MPGANSAVPGCDLNIRYAFSDAGIGLNPKQKSRLLLTMTKRYDQLTIEVS